MIFKKIKLNFKITNRNINLIIYDLNFGILFSQIYLKNNIILSNILFMKILFNEYLLESGVLKIKKNKKIKKCI
jgi:hypothetical protein